MSTTPAPSRRREQAREERVVRRRRQILDAAARIMYETGYHDMSMQAVAEAAEVSVGLIYQYFGSKQDILLSVIVDILEEFRESLPRALAQAGADPRDRVADGFRAFCAIIDGKRQATLLAYRESQTLDDEGRSTIIRMEVETMEPIRQAIVDGIEAGVFRPVPAALVAHNLKIIAHGWALKHWDLGSRMTLREYVDAQLELLFASLSPA